MDHLAHREARRLVDQFVRQWPKKAVDILVRCCDDENILREIMTDLAVQQPGTSQQEAFSPSNGLNLTIGRLGQPRPTSSRDSQHSASPPPRQTPRRRPSSNARPFAPPSPPSTRTASSVISHSSKDDVGPGEYIVLIIITEKSVDEKVARMRNEPIMHSVMREDVARKRKITTSRAEECYVSVPHPTVARAHTQVPVLECATVEWRRPQSNSTHSTTFYIVPRDVLDIDILLGYEDSGEGASGYPPPVAPQPQRQRAFHFEEYDHNKRPPAPTPPLAHSYHRSTIMYDGSHPTTPVQQQQQHSVHQFVENLVNRQHAHGAAVEPSRLSQHSPAVTVRGSHSSHIEHPQPLRPVAAPNASGHNVDQNAASDKVRLNFDWGPTPMKVWIELRAPGEAFFEAFQQQVQKRKGMFERSQVTIYLKKDKKTPDDEACELSLDMNDLEADWEATVEWLEENRRGEPPRVYGRVQVGEG
ncbi:hypothetical protein K458DRAFT_402477 [Lentithecium fluviatile CBS 122367]|uniref:Uncharacterized protein n=1 Tax=Lentithecium fluviatile CBS 122367 TaxID=1168545 RepID=A0A6G1J9W2_9PLEO|nr:hypothetical protein K458DRAFT_402477 [Lentithecium fluviatile CBS 122367]